MGPRGPAAVVRRSPIFVTRATIAAGSSPEPRSRRKASRSTRRASLPTSGRKTTGKERPLLACTVRRRTASSSSENVAASPSAISRSAASSRRSRSARAARSRSARPRSFRTLATRCGPRGSWTRTASRSSARTASRSAAPGPEAIDVAVERSDDAAHAIERLAVVRMNRLAPHPFVPRGTERREPGGADR